MSSKKEEEKKKRDKEVQDTIKACRQKHTDACHYLAIEKSQGHISNKYDVDNSIERLFNLSNKQDENVKHLKERIDSLSEIIFPPIIPGRRGGGRRTRGKLRAKSRAKSRKKRRKSRRKSRRKKRRRKKRTKRRR